MRFKLTQECGQRWYRFNSWFPRRPHDWKVRHAPSGIYPVWVRRFAGFRRFSGGVAIGPIMFFWRYR